MNKLTKLQTLRESHPNAQRRFTSLAISTAQVELEIRTLRGDEYSVVEIVALRPDIVIRPLGSKVPEFVPADIHTNALHTFANRPVVMNHPVDSSGNGVSANTPDILESYQFGHVFDPYYDDDKGLVLPSWLSDELANNVDEASDVITDFRAGESREISVGVYAYIEEVEGVAPDGTEYGAIWLDYDGDHLAILSKGDIGACSNSAGCGPDFTNASKGGRVNVNKWKDTALKASAKFHRLMFNGEYNDRELSEKLYDALRIAEGDDFWYYGWITAIYAKQGIVTYKSFDQESDSMKEWKRGYKLSDGSLTLKNDRVEVLGYEPVIKGAVDDSADASNTPRDDARGNNPTDSAAVTDNSADKEEPMPKIAKEIVALVGAIIDCAKCPFTEDDKSFLEAKDEKWLEGIIEHYADSGDDNTDADAADNTPPPAAPDGYVAVPKEQWEATQTSLAEMKPAADAWQRQRTAEKARLLTAIDAANPSIEKEVYSEWSVNQLRKYAKDVVKGGDSDAPVVTDYSLLASDPPTGDRITRKPVSGLAHLRRKRNSATADGSDSIN